MSVKSPVSVKRENPSIIIADLALTALSDLSAILHALQQLAGNNAHLKSLARVGAELADTRHNLIDVEREAVQ